MKIKHLWIAVIIVLALSIVPGSFINAAPLAVNVSISGCIYEGVTDASGNPKFGVDASPLTGATVMVQNQHSGGAFIAYGTTGLGAGGNCWTASVPDNGDYVIMFNAPDHDLTSREVTIDSSGGVTHPKRDATGAYISTSLTDIDAYLPPLYDLDGGGTLNDLPRAALLVYAFYDNYVNGEPDDYPEDIHLNGVTWTVCPEDDYPGGSGCQSGTTGSQSSITATDGTPVCNNATDPGSCDGLYYFTNLPPGEVIATSTPDQVHLYPQRSQLDKLNITASTEFYLNYTEEGGPVWDPKLYPGDSGTEGGAFLIWHSYVAKLGQFGDPTNPNPFNPGLVGSISGLMLDADGNDPAEPFPIPGPPGVSPNLRVPEGLIILYTNDELLLTEPVATTEADPLTGAYSFVNVPPGRYKMMNMDVPLDYVWTQNQVTVLPDMNTLVSPWAPRFFGRGQGCVIDASTGLPMSGMQVNLRYKSGSIKQTETTGTAPSPLPAPSGDGFTYPTACAGGWYNFDDMPEIEVEGHVDVELPPNYRGAMITDTFTYNNDPSLPPTPTSSYTITHNAMNRHIAWLTANYRADLYLEPIPATEGDIRGWVFNDHFSRGTWVGDGLYDEHEERTLHGVTVELYDATGTTLLDTTTTGNFSKPETAKQGYQQPYTMPPNELGGVFVGPMIGFYEFRGLAPGDYVVKVYPSALGKGLEGFSASPLGTDVFSATVVSALATEHDFGVNTRPDPSSLAGVPLAGEIEGGVFDDLNIDNNPTSLLFMEKAGVPGTPIGVYDHLGYLMGAGYMGDPYCNPWNNAAHPPADYPGDPYSCSSTTNTTQKPEMERRFAPGVHIYYGNDPAFPGYNPNYLPLVLPYTFGQGKYKFEADWSLVPVAFGGIPLAGNPPVLPANGPVINAAAVGGSYMITGANFGPEQGYSTVSLGGRELEVISWSDTEIHVEEDPSPMSDLILVTTTAGPSNVVSVSGIAYTPGPNTVFVDASHPGPGDGSQANPYPTITEALNNLPSGTPRIVRVAAGTYNERIQITENDVYLIGAGPLETTINGLSPLSVTAQGFSNGGGPVIFIGAGGETGNVDNIMINGFTITGGTVNKDDIGAGIFGDYGNTNIDINNNHIVQNGGYYGGGIWLHYSNHNVKIWSNTIAENGNFGGYGGGISVNDEPEYGEEHSEPEHVWDDHCPPTCVPTGVYEIYNNHIHHNYSPDYGGGISLYEIKDHLKIFGNLIEKNKSEDHGGGMFFEDTGPIDIHHNKFLRNLCYDDGGAISFEDVGDDIALIKIYNNLFAENVADDRGENHARGGALAFDDTFYVELYNNTIVNNIVAGSYNPAGGGIDSERHGHEYNGSEPLGRDIVPGYSDPKIYNNIIWGNMRLHYDQPGGAAEEENVDYTWGINYQWFPDNLHVDNPAEQDSWLSHGNSESLTYVEYNVISDGEYASRLGNVSAGNPEFMALSPSDWYLDLGNAPMGDWHIKNGSNAIDQAPVDDAPKDDLDEHPRNPYQAMVDMGAYEFQWNNPGSLIIVKDANPADGTNFSFGGHLGSFSLDDATLDDGDSITDTITYMGLAPDKTYMITETMLSDWYLPSVSCGGSSGLITLISDTNDSLIGVAVPLQQNDVVTCTFTNELKPALTVTKVVIPDTDSGLFNLQIDGSNVVTNVSNGGSTGAVLVNGGSHTITETAGTGTDLTNYDTIIGGDCDADGNITLASNQDATCVITNTRKPTLTVIKVLTPSTDDGRFSLWIDGSDVVTNVGDSGSTGAVEVSIGSHTISETAITGTNLTSYDAVIGGDCDTDGNITLTAGKNATCVITNTRKPTLTVTKVLLPDTDNGRFNLWIDGSDVVTNVGDGGNTGAVMVSIGSHTINETAITGTNLTGYETVIGGDCDTDGNITLTAGENATCVITNTRKPTLTVTKVLLPDTDNGLFNLQIDSSDVVTDVGNDGSTGAVMVSVGSHTISETASIGADLTNYETVIGGDCNADGSVTLDVGENATCVITNTRKPTLTVIKHVVNDDGGTAQISDFTLYISDTVVTNSDVNTLEVGVEYVVREDNNLSGYAASVWGGDCATDGAITLIPGLNATCVITNDDIAPTITLIKEVINDNGGSASATDFGLSVGGNPVDSGDTVAVKANSAISLTEAGLAGYNFVGISGDAKCPAALGGTVTLDEGENVTCVITNDDIAPTITLIKEVINDNGGSASANDFGLSVGGNPVNSGDTVAVKANSAISLTEAGLAGYAFVGISGDTKCPAALDGTITLDEGEDITCTITNDDIVPTLTVVKEVVNDNGGTALVSDFTLYISDTVVTSGKVNTLTAGIEYVVSEDNLPGYAAPDWGGDCAADGTITLIPGQDATCTITNTDIAPTLTVIKKVVPAGDDGKFDLLIDGNVEASGVGDGGSAGPVALNAGPHTVSELLNADPTIVAVSTANLADYYESVIGSDCAADGTIDLKPGDNATCIITNTRKPLIGSSPPITSVFENNPYSYTVVANSLINFTAGNVSAAGNALTIIAPTLPAWLTLTDHGNGTATLSGTPGSDDVGNHLVVIEVTDGFATGTQTFTITVKLLNYYYFPIMMKGFAP